MSGKRYGVILGNLGNTCERFCSGGYKEKVDTMTMLKQAASIEGVSGVELIGTWDLRPDNVGEMSSALNDLGLTCIAVIPDLFSQAFWGWGAYMSRDPGVRRKAVDVTLEACEMAGRMNCSLITIWPGQDGYDYPLQADYQQARDWIAEGLRECAEGFPDVRFALEYKPKEPRTHSYLARMADTLLVCQEIGTANVGVTIDVGHALIAYEDVAESAILADRTGRRLFHMHFNDNYRSWDDDMIVGSIHTVEYIELLYWLDRVGYDGWYSMDLYPYREHGGRAVGESIKWLQGLQAKVDEYRPRIDDLLQEGDATRTSALLREMLL